MCVCFPTKNTGSKRSGFTSEDLFLGDAESLRLEKLLELDQLSVQARVSRVARLRVCAGVRSLELSHSLTFLAHPVETETIRIADFEKQASRVCWRRDCQSMLALARNHGLTDDCLEPIDPRVHVGARSSRGPSDRPPTSLHLH